jgi:hypothetical protein
LSSSTAPVILTLNVPVSIPDGNITYSNRPSANVQIQNSSTFVLTIVAAGLTYTIQSFTAQTISLAPNTGTPINISPSSASIVSPAFVSSLIAVWLLEGESPPMQDGPLTAQAVSASILSTQTQRLATAAAGAGSPLSVTLPPWVVSVQLLSAGFPATINVQGLPSGIFYFSTVNQAPVSPISFDVAAGVDSSILIQWTGPAVLVNPIYVIGLAVPSGDHSVSSPVVVAQTDPVPHTNHAPTVIVCPAGTVTTLIGAPPVGFVWEVVHLELNAPTTVTTPTALAYIAGLTSSGVLVGGVSSTAGIFVFSNEWMLIAEGLNVHNSTAVVAGATVWYRPVRIQ